MWIICTPWSRRCARIGQMWPPFTVNRYRTPASWRTRATRAPPSVRAAAGPAAARPSDSPILRVPSIAAAVARRTRARQATVRDGLRGVTSGGRVTIVPQMTGREALLSAFDRLFDAAAKKLNVACTPEERTEAKEQFASRFDAALEVAKGVQVAALPEEALAQMEAAIEQLSPAELAGVIASIPLAQQTQEMLRAVAFRQAEQRLLEHLTRQADTRYGGN